MCNLGIEFPNCINSAIFTPMVTRLIEKKLIEMAKKFPVVAVTGPRQSGKTTLCKKIFNKHTYISLENPDIREYAETDPRGFLETYNGKVILDEVQLVPKLFSYIQGIVDQENIPGQYILTGSQNFLLLEKINQSLAGRVYIYHLLPFSSNELKSKYTTSLLSNIFKGGYPRIYDKSIAPMDFFPSYVQTYLERDVRNTLNIKNLSLFTAFLKICAGRVGQLFNSSTIGNELGINHKTVKSWLTILEASFVIYRLQPWHKNFNKRIIKSPKIYFYDTGLACYLLGIKKEEEVNIHFAKGALFENYIIAEHIKNTWNKGHVLSSYFWRNSAGNEIDLLIESGNDVKIVEIKSAKTLKNSFFKGLNYFENLAQNHSIQKYIVYGGSDARNQFNTNLLPWNKINELS